MRKAVLSAILIFCLHQSYSQIDTVSYSPVIDATFQKILTTVFKNEKVSQYIFDHDYILLFDHDYTKDGAAFIYSNRRFNNHATNFGTKKVSYPTVGLQMSNIFDIEKQNIFVFGWATGLQASTDNADTLIVLQKLKVKMGRANLSFYTTNSQSKKYQNRYGKQKFVRIQCEAILEGSEWALKKVKITDFPFKSIYDKE